MRRIIAIIVVGLSIAMVSGSALAQEAEPSQQTRVLEQLAPLVDQGVITQDQAQAIADHFASQIAERLEQRRERAEQRQAFHQELLDLLEITSEELREAFQAGMTLADVATEQGVDVEDVIELLTSQAEQRLAAAVEDGKLTEEEAAEKLAEVSEKIEDKVNNGGGFGHRHRRGGPGRFGGSFPSAGGVDAVSA